MSLTPAPALEKGLKILEIIVREEQVSFNQLQSMTGYNVSSLNRYLHTLRHLDYIQKNLDNKYIIGLKFFSLAEKNNRWHLLKEVAKKHLVDISDKHGISLLLIGYSKDQLIVLTKKAHKDNITMMSIDTRKCYEDAFIWALPYIIHLEQQEQNRIEELYINKDNNILGNIDELKSHFLKNGYIFDNGFVNKNILRIGVPLYAGESKPIALLAAGTFKQHLEDNIDDVIKDMRQASTRISELVF
jgi:DNA-binding IclR family transcriptional regulator